MFVVEEVVGVVALDFADFAMSRGRAFGSGSREGGVYTRESNVLKQSVS